MSYDLEIGTRVALVREHRELNQSELAKAMRKAGHVSITPGRMWEIENGKRSVKAAELADLCRILQAPSWWMLGLDPQEARVIRVAWNKSPPGSIG